MIRVPTRVMWPFTLSDRAEETARVEPGSIGARRALHSSNPDLRDCNVSWRDSSSHANSAAYQMPISIVRRIIATSLTREASSAFLSSSGGNGGHTDVDIVIYELKFDSRCRDITCDTLGRR